MQRFFSCLRKKDDSVELGSPASRTTTNTDDCWESRIKAEVGGFKGGCLQASVQEVEREGGLSCVAVSLALPDSTTRAPADICCVVDISGSMGLDAPLRHEQSSVSTGLSLLDIVRHGVKMISRILGPADRLALVVYDTNAEVIFDLTQMGPGDGRKDAERKLDSLRPKEQTNLWAGLRTGLDVLNRARLTDKGKGRISAVLLLTDGVPNNAPPEGHLPALMAYKEKHGWMPTISTFGFGYDLDSVLLRDLASTCGGSYTFIPDAGFVCTALGSAVSNVLATGALSLELIIVPLEGCSISRVLGNRPMTKDGTSVKIDCGSLQYGQAREIVFYMDVLGPRGGPCCNTTLLYRRLHLDSSAKLQPAWEIVTNLTIAERRLLAMDVVQQAMQAMITGDAKAASEQIRNLVTDVRAAAGCNEPSTLALVKDLEGQVSQALSNVEWFQRWGIHYLPSLVNAHILQQCNNFKDPGIQVYGGPLFQTLRDEADAAFVSLPCLRARNIGNGPDPEVLAALPPDVRAELEAEQTGRPSPEFLAALPANIRLEFEQQSNAQLAGGTPSPEYLAGLPPDIRAEVEAQHAGRPSPEFLAGLPPEIRAELEGNAHRTVRPVYRYGEGPPPPRPPQALVYGEGPGGNQGARPRHVDAQGRTTDHQGNVYPWGQGGPTAEEYRRADIGHIADHVSFMRAYHNPAGMCFDGAAQIVLASGAASFVRDLRRGAEIHTPEGLATVVCVVETICATGMQLLSNCRGSDSELFVTPWHPVRIAGEWCFPHDICLPQWRHCPAVYNLVLDCHHVVVLNGVECATLGHGFTGPVVGHSFYGTEAVLRMLSLMPGWDQGLVRLGSTAPRVETPRLPLSDQQSCLYNDLSSPRAAARVSNLSCRTGAYGVLGDVDCSTQRLRVR